MRIAMLLGVLTLALVPFVAADHETRDIRDGRYVVEIGFLDEPAYLSQPNALFLRVGEYGTGGTQPVEGLASSLQAEVEKEGNTLPLALVPQQEAGVYHARFIPTALGDYTFRIFGEVGEAEVDESFTSSPTTFAPVEPLDRFQFPANAPAGEELVNRLDGLAAETSAARTLGLAGVAVGVVGLVVALLAVGFARGAARAASSRPLHGNLG
ncbi:MAG: hypothetical protein H0U10_02705 [Chloroflexia bacterium]|nr:hypothetical protein [Chloroflexia bacterium]